MSGARDREGHDRLTLHVDAGDDGRLDVAGQVAADLVDGVLHILHGLVGRHVHAEFDHRGGQPVRDGRDDVLDPGDACDGILDLLGDLAFHLGRGGARLRHADRDQRHVDVRETG